MTRRRRFNPGRLQGEQLAKLLRGTCYEWPECCCGEKWRYWDQPTAPGAPPLSDERFEWALLDIAAMLACISAHCWDRRQRQHCARQLLSPVFDEVTGRGGRWTN
jgi:hypothetical protein